MVRNCFKLVVLVAVFGLAAASSARATPGERHYVQRDDTKLFAAPRSNAPVLTRLGEGARVIEWQRQGAWVKVSRLGMVGQDGWIKTSRLVSETPGSRYIEIEAGRSGHFELQAEVNGTPVRFLVDTGATFVMLSPADARRVGFPPERLTFDALVSTANGVASVARVNLQEIKAGQLTVRGVGALVGQRPMAVSLLGMNFLRRLDGYEVRNGRLVLRW